MSTQLTAKMAEFAQLKQASLRKIASTPTAQSIRALQRIEDSILPTREDVIYSAKLAGAVTSELDVGGRKEQIKLAHPDYANIPYYLHDLPTP